MIPLEDIYLLLRYYFIESVQILDSTFELIQQMDKFAGASW